SFDSMSKKLRLIISVLLLSFVAWKNWHRVAESFAHLRIELWVAAVGLYALAQIVSSLRWQLLARPLGFQQSLGQYISYYYLGMFFNLVLPTSVGGDVVRAWYLDGGQKRRGVAFLTVLQDRFNGLMVLLAIVCVAVTVYPGRLPPWIPWSAWGCT